MFIINTLSEGRITLYDYITTHQISTADIIKHIPAKADSLAFQFTPGPEIDATASPMETTDTLFCRPKPVIHSPFLFPFTSRA
jgi:hypothetical protein